MQQVLRGGSRQGGSGAPLAIAGLLAVAMIFGRLTSPSAASTPTMVSSCQLLNTPGFYQVQGNITATGNCFVISSTGVTLSLLGNLTGDGTGTGILIMSNATGTVIAGTDPGGPTGKTIFISNFKTGLEVDGAAVTIFDLHVSGNTDTGVLLNGANTSVLAYVTADSNAQHGVHFQSTTAARVNNINANMNGMFGVWVDGSSSMILEGIGGGGNGRADLEIGNSSVAAMTSNSNILDFIEVFSAPFGVVVEKGSGSNIISEGGLFSGEPPNTTDDLLDNNRSCDHNVWFNNTYPKRKPKCIK